MERCVVGWAGVRSEETDNPEESRGWTAVGVVGASLKGFFSLARGVSWSGVQCRNMIWKYLKKTNSSSSILAVVMNQVERLFIYATPLKQHPVISPSTILLRAIFNGSLSDRLQSLSESSYIHHSQTRENTAPVPTPAPISPTTPSSPT